jgi:serine/threonine-protein kinase
LSLESIGPAAILSPDGTRVVFVSKHDGGKDRLFTRRLDEPTPTELAGTDGAHAPFFSPDGQWVGFFAGGKLKKARVDGSRVTNLCDASAGRGASWSDDGTFIVAALDNQSALSRVPAEGGSPAPLTRLGQGERTHRWPVVVPGRNAVVFMVNGAPGNFADSRIAVAALDSTPLVGRGGIDHRTLVDRPSMYPRYASNGHLMFVSRGTIYAMPLDADRLDVTGAPTAVLDSVASVANYEDFGSSQFDISQSGTLLYHRGETVGLRTIAWLDAAGTLETVLGEPGMYIYPKVSPDGREIAYGMASGTTADIWVYDWRTRRKTKLTEGPGQKMYPVWTPDGRYLVFAESGAIVSVRADGSAAARVLIKSAGSASPYAFSADGAFLAYVAGSTDKGWSLMTVPITHGRDGLNAGSPDRFVELESGAATTAFSPDGHWIAYTSNESGTFEVYVREFPGKGTRTIISSGGGMMPMWSHNGRDLFYRTEDQRLMAVSYTVKKDGTFVAESPRVWSSKSIANLGMSSNVDLAPDGRFAVLVPADPPEPQQTRGHFTLVLNFADDIRRRFAR